METWLTKVGVGKLKCFAMSPDNLRISTANLQNLMERLPRGAETVIAAKGNQIGMAIVLEWDVQQGYDGQVSLIFGHVDLKDKQS